MGLIYFSTVFQISFAVFARFLYPGRFCRGIPACCGLSAGIDKDPGAGVVFTGTTLTSSNLNPLCQPWRVGHAKSSRKTSLTSVTLQATLNYLRIRNFAHKGLRTLYSDNSAKGVPPDSADAAHPDWRPQRHLEPDRNTQSASDVPHSRHGSRNLRLEFGRLPLASKELCPWP